MCTDCGAVLDIGISFIDADSSSQNVQVQHGVTGLPGAFINFDVSPIQLVHTEWRQSFAHFVTSCVERLLGFDDMLIPM